MATLRDGTELRVYPAHEPTAPWYWQAFAGLDSGIPIVHLWTQDGNYFDEPGRIHRHDITEISNG